MVFISQFCKSRLTLTDIRSLGQSINFWFD